MPTTTSLDYGTVDCRIVIAGPDLGDSDVRTDELIPQGTVYLRARKDAVTTTTLLNRFPTIVLPDVIPLVLDGEGYACPPDALGAPTSQRSIDLPAIEGMTWQVSFDLGLPPYAWQQGVEMNRVQLPGFDIPVKAGETTHIADYLPMGVEASTGTVWVKGDQGFGVQSARTEDGTLYLTLEDGTTLPGVQLPPSMVPGPISSVSIGTVDSGDTPAASVTGQPGNQKLNLTLPRGPVGATGAGIPAGGNVGQVPVKAASGGTEWADFPKPVLDPATQTKDGLMPAADKTKLDKATNTGTANTLMLRDASGRAQVANPSANLDVMNLQSAKTVTDALSTRMNGYDAQLTSVQTTTPTLEELIVATSIQSIRNGTAVQANLTWNANFTPFVAPFDLQILSCTMMWEAWTQAADDTNYMAVTLRKLATDGTTFTTIAGKNTKKTGGEGITQRKQWAITGSSDWSTTNAKMLGGEGVNLAFSYAGNVTTANAMLCPIWITMRYAPL